jgi:hypothetical protein
MEFSAYAIAWKYGAVLRDIEWKMDTFQRQEFYFY